MTAELELEFTAETLERAARELRKYRDLVNRILGTSPEEVRETLQAMAGLTPAQIRDALWSYKAQRHSGPKEG